MFFCNTEFIVFDSSCRLLPRWKYYYWHKQCTEMSLISLYVLNSFPTVSYPTSNLPVTAEMLIFLPFYQTKTSAWVLACRFDIEDRQDRNEKEAINVCETGHWRRRRLNVSAYSSLEPNGCWMHRTSASRKRLKHHCLSDCNEVEGEERPKHVAEIQKENHPVSFTAFLMQSLTVWDLRVM